MNPHSYVHLIFNKGVKKIWWRIDNPFNKCYWENQISACRTLILDPCLLPCTNINSKWIKDLNISPETLNVVQEKTGNTLEAIGIYKDFLNRT
jgi:hypothetical protein